MKKNYQAETEAARKAIADAGLSVVGIEKSDEILEAIAENYKNNGIFKWICGGRYNPEIAKAIMDTSIKSLGPKALMYCDREDNPGSYAIWITNGSSRIDVLDFIKTGGKRLVELGGMGAFFRLFSYNLFIMGVKKRHTGHNDWYLFGFTIKDGLNKNAMSELMLRPMTEFCWENNSACYVEMSTAEEVNMFRQVGFQVKESSFIPHSNVKYYAMML